MLETVDIFWAILIVILSGVAGTLINPLDYKYRYENRPGKQMRKGKRLPKFEDF